MRDFKKYLKDGRRVAAFGKQIGNEVEVFLLYCSKKDQFRKAYAKSVYQQYQQGTLRDQLLTGYTFIEDIRIDENGNEVDKSYIKPNYAHPVILRIPIEEGDSAEYTFKTFMRKNFFRLKTTSYKALEIVDYLTNDRENILLEKTIRYRYLKLSEF